MSKILNIAAAIAILSVGIMKADAAPVTEADCANRAQLAYAAATARDAGKTDRDMAKAIDETMEPQHRATAKRIVFMVFNNHSLTPSNAFDKEKSYCKSQIWSSQ